MKPLHFLFIAVTGALSSCGSMHEPIYYDNGETKQKEVAKVTVVSTQQVVGAVATAQQTDIATPLTVSVATVNQMPKVPKQASPFMQPDVFAMPKSDDLKETATSTRSNVGNPGLTVPQQ